MLFTSGTYYVFLIAVFFLYWAAAWRIRLRLAVLLVASCFFYAFAGGRALLLLVAISGIDFTTTHLMSGWDDRTRRRLLLSVSLTIDIGALCVFEYAGFLIESASGGLSVLGLSIPESHLNIVAPIGISFFIFQSLAYVIDVYRKDTQPARSYADYLAFVSFFPTIVAGPILRAKQLLPQLRARLMLDSVTGGQALFLIAIGLIKKIAIADYLSANLVERVFDFPERFSSLEVLAGVYGYGLQIYADFSGYSDIAIGSAMLLGFTLPVNFQAPYRAVDLPDFWRRWHISLSTWLRDYVFFSIAGRRAGNSMALYGGLVVTMLVGGLWHGPAWTFVLWGLLHGVGLVTVRAWASFRKGLGLAKRNTRWSRFASVLITLHFVCFAWIFFRAETVDRAIAVLSQLLTFTTDTSNLAPPLIIIILLGFIAHWIPDGWFEVARRGFVRLPAPVQACVLFALALGLYFVAGNDVAPFIYSRF
ncbi:MAG TPA: MBOAT family O-acyltransferase [Blastocatellia bacterium]|nr:MBOAT family O-acyltransferase [Blastocatellia bacterium]